MLNIMIFAFLCLVPCLKILRINVDEHYIRPKYNVILRNEFRITIEELLTLTFCVSSQNLYVFRNKKLWNKCCLPPQLMSELGRILGLL